MENKYILLIGILIVIVIILYILSRKKKDWGDKKKISLLLKKNLLDEFPIKDEKISSVVDILADKYSYTKLTAILTNPDFPGTKEGLEVVYAFDSYINVWNPYTEMIILTCITSDPKYKDLGSKQGMCLVKSMAEKQNFSTLWYSYIKHNGKLPEEYISTSIVNCNNMKDDTPFRMALNV